MCTEPTNLWVKLVRSKYLRGRRVLDLQRTTTASSWIWQGIEKCKESLYRGICFTIGHQSIARIRDDPWIPALPSFKIPAELPILDHFQRVTDLLTADKTAWDVTLLQSIFPLNLCRIIQSIPIFSGAYDEFVWCPSMSGKFSVKSSYRTNNLHRFHCASRIDKKVWDLLWRSGLHERHKLLAWKILHDAIPTKDRLKVFIPQVDLSCYLCSSSVESIDHLIFECPIAALCWLQSAWQLRIGQFAHLGSRKWITVLLDEENQFQIEVVDKQKMLNYGLILFEQVWLIRNKTRLGTAPPNWADFACSIPNICNQYWAAACNRQSLRTKIPTIVA